MNEFDNFPAGFSGLPDEPDTFTCEECDTTFSADILADDENGWCVGCVARHDAERERDNANTAAGHYWSHLNPDAAFERAGDR